MSSCQTSSDCRAAADTCSSALSACLAGPCKDAAAALPPAAANASVVQDARDYLGACIFDKCQTSYYRLCAPQLCVQGSCVLSAADGTQCSSNADCTAATSTASQQQYSLMRPSYCDAQRNVCRPTFPLSQVAGYPQLAYSTNTGAVVNPSIRAASIRMYRCSDDSQCMTGVCSNFTSVCMIDRPLADVPTAFTAFQLASPIAKHTAVSPAVIGASAGAGVLVLLAIIGAFVFRSRRLARKAGDAKPTDVESDADAPPADVRPMSMVANTTLGDATARTSTLLSPTGSTFIVPSATGAGDTTVTNVRHSTLSFMSNVSSLHKALPPVKIPPPAAVDGGDGGDKGDAGTADDKFWEFARPNFDDMPSPRRQRSSQASLTPPVSPSGTPHRASSLFTGAGRPLSSMTLGESSQQLHDSSVRRPSNASVLSAGSGLPRALVSPSLSASTLAAGDRSSYFALGTSSAAPPERRSSIAPSIASTHTGRHRQSVVARPHLLPVVSEAADDNDETMVHDVAPEVAGFAADETLTEEAVEETRPYSEAETAQLHTPIAVQVTVPTLARAEEELTILDMFATDSTMPRPAEPALGENKEAQ